MRLRKRWLIGMPILVIFVLGRMEFCSFRYDRLQVSRDLGQNAYFQQDSTDSDGLHFVQTGDDPTKPYIMFVHGSPGSLWDYSQYLTDTSLRRQANLISIDRQGFGYSQFGKAKGSLYSHAYQLAQILRVLQNDRVVLVGHSYGGPVIAKAAMEFGNLIKGLVLIAPSISPKHEPSASWRKIVDLPPFRWLTPPALRACNQEILPLREELEQMITSWSNINIPVTVIQGSEDKLVPMENALFAEKMLQNSPSVKVIMLEGENHFILWSRTNLIKDEIAELLSDSEKLIK
ncbi:MAG: alpha/beta hydrolase [Saprospiraceae bacterium]|nr:alpha/beta hydrolase [Saprospiraceae bacterium]